MKNLDVLNYFNDLVAIDQDALMNEFKSLCKSGNVITMLKIRGDALDDRRAECPHCGGFHYTKSGLDKKSRRYKCKECKRTFTEFTGTWLAGFHKKHQIPEFLKSIELNLSLVKTGKNLSIDPSTAFRWRHRFLSAVSQKGTTPFKGITESDETFFLHSQKGKKCEHRLPRNRSKKEGAGITKDYAAVLTTQDRGKLCLSKFINMGGLLKKILKLQLEI